MKEIIALLINNATEIVAILTSLVTLASLVTAMTPTPKDDAIVGKIYKIVEWLALNVGKAKDTPKK
jgi:hypothetical protein